MQLVESATCTRWLVVITANHAVGTCAGRSALSELQVLIYSKAARKPAFVKTNRVSGLRLLLPGYNAGSMMSH